MDAPGAARGPAREPGLLEVRGLRVRYGEREVLRGIDLVAADRQIVCVLGPSGSGKSTLLRVIAGLEPPAAGSLRFAGRDIARLPAHERGVGLMFQDYALFPHRDVGGNVAFGLRMQGWDASRIRARVGEVLGFVGLPDMGSRPVSQLSGGEQQRVALARAIAPGPRLLMLDEPMGSLDRVLRERLPNELREMFGRLGVTVLYVTHDHEEALSVADRVVLLRDGSVAADDDPELLWSRPPSRWVAEFLGFRNVAPARVEGEVLRTPWGDLSRPSPGAPGEAHPGGPLGIVLRPDGFRPLAGGPIRGAVRERRFQGDHVLLVIDTAPAGAPLARLEVEARWSPLPAVGETVELDVEPRAIVTIAGPAAAAEGDPGSTGAVLSQP
jgi:thiamine transport system ATP-binding protein